MSRTRIRDWLGYGQVPAPTTTVTMMKNASCPLTRPAPESPRNRLIDSPVFNCAGPNRHQSGTPVCFGERRIWPSRERCG